MGYKRIGTVEWFNKEKGFGFIKPDPEKDGERPSDVFVHYSSILSKGYKKLEQGDRVSFEVELGKKNKEQATNVEVIEYATADLHKKDYR